MTRSATAACVALLLAGFPALALAETGWPDRSWPDRSWGERFSGIERHETGFQPVTHQFDMRFGMVYSSDRGLEPGHGARYRVTFNHQLDNGWQIGVSLGVSLDTLDRPGSWRGQATGHD